MNIMKKYNRVLETLKAIWVWFVIIVTNRLKQTKYSLTHPIVSLTSLAENTINLVGFLLGWFYGTAVYTKDLFIAATINGYYQGSGKELPKHLKDT